MPLNPEPIKDTRKETVQYEPDEACDWCLLLRYCKRKLNYSGDPRCDGGLVDIFYGSDGTLHALQFRQRDEGDDTVYKTTKPKVYDGEKFVPIADYVERLGDEFDRKTIPGTMVAGHKPNVEDGSHHTGKFPVWANDGLRIGLEW